MKILVYLAILSILICFTGCKNSRVNATTVAKKNCEDLIVFLNEGDTDSIKAMFCTAVSSLNEFDDNLTKAIDFIDGKVLSYDIQAIGSDEKIDNGKQAFVHISPYMWNVKTDKEITYKIRFYSYIVNLENEECVGISEITIERSDGEIFKLGDYNLVR